MLVYLKEVSNTLQKLGYWVIITPYIHWSNETCFGDEGGGVSEDPSSSQL